MRRKHWIPSTIGLALLISAGRECSAQSYAPAPQYYNASAGMPGGSGFPPPMLSGAPPAGYGPGPAGMYGPGDMYTGNPMSHSPISVYPPGQAQLQQQMEPWPNISPYDHSFSQHLNQDGLWFHDFNNRGPKYIFGIDYIDATMKGGSRTPVGKKGANTYEEYMLRLSRLSPDDAVPEDRITTIFDRFNQTTVNNISYQVLNYYDRVNSAEALPDVNGNGMRLHWGVIDPDDSGFILSGWWAQGGQSWDANDHTTRPAGDLQTIIDVFNVFPAGLLPPDDPLVIATNGVYANLRGLPLDDGSGAFGGVTVPYDLAFRVSWKTSVYDVAGDFLMTPIFKRSGGMIRPLWGVRYMRLEEDFRFFGRDSGVIYGIEDPPIPELKSQSIPNFVDNNANGIIDDSIIPEEDTGVGLIFFPQPFEAFLNSQGRSNMIGPELGMRFDLGGDKLNFYGVSKVGILGNFEKMKIRGDNIGDKLKTPIINGQVQPWDPTDDGDLLTPGPGNLHPNAFADSQSHSHISPLLEQSFVLEASVFSYVPLLNKIELLDKAKVSAGWTYIAVFDVVKPDDSIVWQGNPEAGLFPFISAQRDTWHTSNWNFGVSWEY